MRGAPREAALNMKMLDVNVLISVLLASDPKHVLTRAWLRRTLSTGEIVAVSSAVATAAVRLLTNQRIFKEPLGTSEVMNSVEQLLAVPNVLRADPGERNWQIFSRLCEDFEVSGDLVVDATHAATAIEHGAVWVSFDRDFARFESLRWEIPSAP